MLVEVKLLGSIGQKFGRKYTLEIDTAAEALRALAAQIDGFLDYLYEAAAAGINWHVVNDDPLGLSETELDLRLSTNRLIISPRVTVGDGVTKLITGIALVAFSFLVPGGFLLSSATWGLIGAKLAIDGISTLLTSSSSSDASAQTIELASKQGYQGLPVPILYGEVYITDLIQISATVFSEDIALGDADDTVNWGGGSTAEVDPYPTLTKVLLHLDNNLIDEKSNTSPVGINPNFSSVKKKFGSYSFALSGITGGSYFQIPSSSATNSGGMSTTIEGQYLIEAPDSSNTLNQSTLISRYDWNTSLGYYWLYDHTTQEFRFVSDAFTANWAYTLSTVSPNFQHLALSIDTLGQTVNSFVGGIPLGSIAYTGSLGNPALPLLVGANQNISAIDRRLKGYVDEFRLSIGVARYAATFTPPTSYYAAS
jgi:predicted phage tail protein